MPLFYSWMRRLSLVVSLFVLAITLIAIWPDARTFRWIDVIGFATLGLATVVVGAWSFGAWLND